MGFFKQLHEIMDGKVTMTIMRKNGKLTISVLPDGIDKIQPLTVTATPEDLDEGFITAIRKPLADAALVINAEEFNKAVAAADKKPKPALAKKEEPAKASNEPAAVPVPDADEEEPGEEPDEADEDEEQPAKKKAAKPAKKVTEKQAKKTETPKKKEAPAATGKIQLSIL